MAERSPLRPIKLGVRSADTGGKPPAVAQDSAQAQSNPFQVSNLPQWAARRRPLRTRRPSPHSPWGAQETSRNPGRSLDEARPAQLGSKLRPSPNRPNRGRATPPSAAINAERVGPLHQRRRSRATPALPLPNRSSNRPRSRAQSSPWLQGLRLVVLGVGLGAIVGTLISIWDPTGLQNARAQSPQTPPPYPAASLLAPLETKQEFTSLKQQIQSLSVSETGLTPGVFLLDLDTRGYVDLSASVPFSAASTIKLPILVAFLQDVDAGNIRFDEMLEMRPDLIASESGDMQYEAPGTQFSALEVAERMITVSDNTATNMLIDRMGGPAKLNQRFRTWGLSATAIRTPLPDVSGTNTTSPHELVTLMGWVDRGELLSLRSRDRMLEIMRRTVTNTLLNPGLGEGAIIAHKTGDIGSVVGDVGLVDMPNGKRYLVSVLVKRPHDDQRANELIRQFSAAIYSYLNQGPTLGSRSAPATSVTPGAATQALQ